MKGDKVRGPLGVWRALLWSLGGLKSAFLREESFRLELALFVILAPLAFWLGETAVERALLFGVLMLVLVVELLNSALEAVYERYGDDDHPLTGAGKDMGSAAVFLADVLAVIVWALVLWR